MTQLESAVLATLASGETIDAPTAIVVAHPDDEVLAMGGRLSTFRHLTLIQLTNGAPASGVDARHLGFADITAYADAREREARRALAVLGLNCRRVRLGASDQDSIFSARRLAEQITSEMRGAEIVFTHPYEGGHPDHDTAALIVQRVCAALESDARPCPARVEFASYHLRDSEMITGAFFAAPESREITIELTADRQALKCRALAAYASQAAVLSRFDPSIERYRAAPDYDFSRSAPPGCALYDLFGWEMTAAKWRAVARAWGSC
jgi:LmbE family N-acetylglucosaminyl deacetylase